MAQACIPKKLQRLRELFAIAGLTVLIRGLLPYITGALAVGFALVIANRIGVELKLATAALMRDSWVPLTAHFAFVSPSGLAIALPLLSIFPQLVSGFCSSPFSWCRLYRRDQS